MPRSTRSPRTAWKPTLRRSVRLLREFRFEQSDPRRFYTAIADDSIGQLSTYLDLTGALVLDVGGGPGYFRDAFRAAGATYVALDADVGELSGLGTIAGGTVIGDGMRLPFADSSVDLCYSSNVLEHVPDPWRMADEMLRVTRPGGVAFISYTVWYGPWGGHETAPWHYLGGGLARRRYRRKHGHEPKNKYGESLYPVTVRAGLAWAAVQQHGEVLDTVPRYNPWWARFLTRVPLVRELVTWNLLVVVRKR
ncbi:class I SAM-dependent methyltransferase [Nocardioides guangzhouensis]|uniref:Class I SAM-dependent methyltransferase n=1 Tax=Nocardioides guangzhouensis TaxID=2497878 RepID=A0A4Q4ZBJ1_9ACTN|nr:class I SAM-dependent methyltransferase [Nocardioides guangzhouensis]RYP84945.1 class I SAM-dependent methyltransferase [Nocardioides guangzhouensis]